MLFYRIFPAIAAGCAVLMDVQRPKVDNGWLLFRMLGAGDIKLLSVLGSLMGPVKILNCMFYSFLIGAVLSAALMVSSGIFSQRILYLLRYLCGYLKTGKREPYYKSGMPPENYHFTVPIFQSALLYAGGVY